MNIMEGLVTFDADLKPVPSLAQSWTISQDGRIYTFKLRPGVKWSDGVPLKAADFVYSWKRLLSPLTAAAYGYFLSTSKAPSITTRARSRISRRSESRRWTTPPFKSSSPARSRTGSTSRRFG